MENNYPNSLNKKLDALIKIERFFHSVDAFYKKQIKDIEIRAGEKKKLDNCQTNGLSGITCGDIIFDEYLKDGKVCGGKYILAQNERTLLGRTVIECKTILKSDVTA